MSDAEGLGVVRNVPASGEPDRTPRQWLGHRDWCPTQWGDTCDCPCSEKQCPGINDCDDLTCSIAAYLNQT